MSFTVYTCNDKMHLFQSAWSTNGYIFAVLAQSTCFCHPSHSLYTHCIGLLRNSMLRRAGRSLLPPCNSHELCSLLSMSRTESMEVETVDKLFFFDRILNILFCCYGLSLSNPYHVSIRFWRPNGVSLKMLKYFNV